MAPPPQGSRQGGKEKEEDKYKNAKDAKHLLDIIGKDVYDEVHRDDADYRKYLQGHLEDAIFEELPSGQQTEKDPCKLNHRYHTTVTSGYDKENPCENRPRVRFSDTEGAQCDKKKIKDSKGGACAPFRRLHLCDQHLSHMKDDKITRHNLLADVCEAAKFEGQSITQDYPKKYLATYNDSPPKMCTMLARSFADIADIVRGKDLYLGDKKEKDRLQSTLKRIFQKIYDNLMEDLKKDPTKKMAEAEKRYNDLKGDFFKLREDWWDANRETVWEAITCDAGGYSYFRQTACAGRSPTDGRCRCVANVPTYFDYVPQYLRWLHEWAEDFCRKRKHKLENAIQKCRKGEDGTDKYCDLNGLNCERTKYKIAYFVEGADCKKCSVACKRFVEWIAKQKKEFLKQKQKYEKEMEKYTNGESGSRRRRRDAGSSGDSSNYDGYEKKFYKVLQSNGYETVDDFLEKLSNEEICTKVKDDKGGKIDFKNVDVGKNGDSVASDSNNSNKTFAPTEYCDPCPDCGVERKSDGNEKWESIKDDCSKEEKTSFNNTHTTTIPVLTPEKKKTSILQKYKTFCANGDKKNEQIKNWTCHYEQTDKSNICVLQDGKQHEKEHKVTSYYSFFYGSIIDMLNDSIEWRAQLNSCINNGKKDCISKCNSRCDCYKRWVEKKQTEWGKIKDHFGKQEDLLKDMKGEFFQDIDPDSFLELYLKITFLEDMEQAQGDPKAIEKFKEILGKENQDELVDSRTKTIIDKFLQEELKEAEDCLKTHKKDKCDEPQQSAEEGGARAGQPPAGRSETGKTTTLKDHETVTNHENEEDEDDEDEEEGEGDEDNVDDDEEAEGSGKGDTEVAKEKTAKDTEGTGETATDQVAPPEKKEEEEKATDTSVNVCETVAEALTGSLKDACDLKYNKGKNYGWKCVPTTSGDKTDTERARRVTRSAPSGEKATGSICVPPRRRRLYVGKLQEWVDKQVAQAQTTDTQTQGNGDDPQVALLHAFVKSAAIETFFLWHRYKKEWLAQKKAEQGLNGGVLGTALGDMTALSHKGAPTQQPGTHSGDQTNPHNQLLSGKIPNDFLRQMFYTLGDYRDICVGNKTMIEALEASGDKNIDTITNKIKQILNGENEQQPAPKTGNTTPESWWNQNAKHIWEGMICALTYKESEQKGGGGNPTVDEQVEKAFFGTPRDKPDNQNGKPGPPLTNSVTTGTSNGTYQSRYKYDQVKLKEDESGSKQNQTTSASSGDDPLNNPKLTQFVKIPTFFRWLHEWGSDFCGKRARMLKDIIYECRNNDLRGHEHCSGDGLNCKEKVPDNDKIFGDFNCQSCITPCRFYRKWIERKKIEFHKQSNAYGQQKTDAESNTGATNHNEFVKKLKQYEYIHLFLDSLKNGPCKNNDNDKTGNSHIKFDVNADTFKHTDLCNPCPIFGVNCKNGDCNNAEKKSCKENGKDFISAEDIKTMKESIDVDMRVSDNNPNGNKFADLQACENAHIFEGIRKDVWKCVYFCKSDVCGLKKNNNNNNNDIDDKQIILVRALIKRWLEYFFEDYNKIKHKISHCTKTDQGSKCISGCEEKCKCVEQWIEKKKEEWKKIKKRYIEQYKKQNDGGNTLTNFLEILIPETHVKKATGRKNISDFESKVCNCPENSKQKDEKKDIIDCMLNKLTEKIKTESCPTPTSGTPCTQTTSQQTLDLDDDEPTALDEDDDKKVGKPSFCKIDEPPEPVDEGGCEPPATTKPEEPESTTSETTPSGDATPEQTAEDSEDSKTNQDTESETKSKEEKTSEAKPPAPAPAREPFDPTILQTTIPFGVALALGSIAFFFMK
ncbi:hypothetical protein PFTANZ_06125, partial [Plasmodium falciparum Tanzania (2000708)]